MCPRSIRIRGQCTSRNCRCTWKGCPGLGNSCSSRSAGSRVGLRRRNWCTSKWSCRTRNSGCSMDSSWRDKRWRTARWCSRAAPARCRKSGMCWTRRTRGSWCCSFRPRRRSRVRQGARTRAGRCRTGRYSPTWSTAGRGLRGSIAGLRRRRPGSSNSHCRIRMLSRSCKGGCWGWWTRNTACSTASSWGRMAGICT